MGRATRSAGFTLIEVLVALAILSVSLAVLFEVFSDGLDRIGASESEMVAGSLAGSLLDEIGVTLPLRVGDQHGEFNNGFHWRLHIVPYGSDEDRKAGPVGAFTVTASILWQERGRQRHLTLTALRLGTAEQAK